MMTKYNDQFLEAEIEHRTKTHTALRKAKAATKNYKPVRIDSKTTIYIAPDRDENEARREFLARRGKKINH